MWWSWLLTAVGVTGFVLAGRKVWWAWWINLACQALWVGYALATRNAVAWTRDRPRRERCGTPVLVDNLLVVDCDRTAGHAGPCR